MKDFLKCHHSQNTITSESGQNAVNVLAIGGSDPSSGAGIQSDIRATSALGINCFSVITAITSQNSTRFLGVEPVPANAVAQQLDSVLSDFEIDRKSVV